MKKTYSYLGQNFITDPELLRKIIEVSKIPADDVVYEVGSGRGSLTRELCKVSKSVHSFELDSLLYDYCKENLHFKNLCMVNGDGLNEKLNISFDIFVSNLPYYESRRAISWLCQKNFKKGIIMLQREFVNKLLSKPGDKNYRAISVLCQHRFSINILMDIPRTSFNPIPKVDSQLIELYPKNLPLPKHTLDNIQFVFSLRKKTVSFFINYMNKRYGSDIDPIKYSDIITNKIASLSPSNIINLTMGLGVM
jgi:16S rRNA (adenine1518-N6/adenine1519-N6)-dimethyltransferase